MKRSTLLALSGSTLLSAALPRLAGASTPIRVGCGPDEDFAEGYYATDMGFFQQAGLDPAITQMNSGAALSAATVSGSLDVATTNMGSIITAHARNIPLQIVGPEAIYSNRELSAALVVDKNSSIRSAADLTGKTVAVSTLNTLFHTSVRNWIDRNGGNSYEVQYVEMPLSAHVPALQAGRIDASALVEPWLSQGKAEVRVLGDPYASVASRFYISCWVASTGWIAQNPATIRTFVDVMKTTAKWANANPKLIAPILSKYLGVARSVIEAVPRTQMGLTLDPALVQPIINLLYRYKLIPELFGARDLFANVPP